MQFFATNLLLRSLIFIAWTWTWVLSSSLELWKLWFGTIFWNILIVFLIVEITLEEFFAIFFLASQFFRLGFPWNMPLKLWGPRMSTKSISVIIHPLKWMLRINIWTYETTGLIESKFIEQKSGNSKSNILIVSGTKNPINKRNLSHFCNVIRWPIQHW